MNVEVTSVAKKDQRLSDVAAAIFVISQEDIRRSGANNIPDLLRMVPGMDVAQIDSNTWAISARGLNSQFVGTLLVLIDGRAVYTPLFGGVNWDTQDVPMEDIDRIEVIRGPGGTIWGAGAVNGVINIITKKAAETQGGLLVAGGGTHDKEFGMAQYGGTFGEHESYRIFTKYLNDGAFYSLNGQNDDDDWHLLHGGFRIDSELSQKDALTTQGDIYVGSDGATIVHSELFPPANLTLQRLVGLSGGNVLTRWNHQFSSGSDITLQFYFDQYTRAGPESKEERNTFDFDFQHHLALSRRNDLIWGAGFRHTGDQTIGTIDQAFVPAGTDGELYTFFAQDQIALKPDRVSVSVGTKVENSYFTGFDVQPSARIAWTPSHRQTVWAAISRASHTPTRRSENLDATLAALPGPAQVVLFGNPNEKSEHVISSELGYRRQINRRLSIDATTFFNVYQDLESIEPQPSFVDEDSAPPVLVIPSLIENKIHGTTEGAEASVSWKVTDRWTLSPGYAFLETHMHADPTSGDTTDAADIEGSSPEHQAQLRSHIELRRNLTWDASGYFAGPLPAQFLPSYTRVDTQLRWKLAEELDLSVVGQNLLKNLHTAFSDYLQIVNSSQIKRSIYLKLTWRF